MEKDKSGKEKKHNKKKTSKDKGKNEITQSHDKTFKSLFSKKYIARDVLEQNLSKDILDLVDMDSLEQQDVSFISEKLEETFSDIIYKVDIDNKEGYIAFLLEHKSYPDKLGIFQVARYIIDIWSKITEENEKDIPIVIPIVVYHGENKWNYKTDIKELLPGYENLPDSIKERLPTMKHDLINLKEQSNEEIKKYRPMTRLVVRVFKYIYADIETLIDELLKSIDELPEGQEKEELQSVLDVLLLYMASANKHFTEEELIKRIRELDGMGAEIMTILQEREQKGIEQGLEQGMELGELKKAKESAEIGIRKGYDLNIITDMTGLTKTEIEKIASKINN